MKLYAIALVLLCGCDSIVPVQGPEGDPGERGEPGPAGQDGAQLEPYIRLAEALVPEGGDTAQFARCDEGDILISGGCDWGEGPRSIAGYPINGDTEAPTAWLCVSHGVSAESWVQARAVCTPGE